MDTWGTAISLLHLLCLPPLPGILGHPGKNCPCLQLVVAQRYTDRWLLQSGPSPPAWGEEGEAHKMRKEQSLP